MAETPEAARIHIVLVEDDPDFVTALRSALRDAADIALVATATTKAQALTTLESPPADVLLVDLGLPDGSGIEVIAAARAAWPGCAIMVCTTFGDEMHVIRSIEAGANGYLLKDSAPKAMTDEIRSLHGGGSPISPLIARQVLTYFRGRPGLARPAADPVPAAALSARERQVLDLITKGFTYDEIAKQMQVSRYTVMTFVRRIYAKLEVKSKTEAIYEARIQGLFPD